MKEYYELKEKLCDELKKYGKKDLTAGSLDVVDKIAHSINNINEVIESYEENGYSNARNNRRNNRNSYEMRYETSNARGGRNRAGYSNEGYSYDDMMSKLYDLVDEAPDDKTRQEFNRFIQKMESM